MKFGLSFPRKLTGAQVSLRVFQAASLLPVLYILIASGYMALFQTGGVPDFLCGLGFCAVSRPEALGLSALFRATSSESAVCAALLAAALLVGILGNKLLKAKEKTAVTARVVYAAFIGADLILRLLPLQMNRAWGLAPALCGFAVRLACAGLVIADLAIWRRGRDIARKDKR